MSNDISPLTLNGYVTVIIPPVPVEFATEWHAPDATLSRGAFATEGEAIAWARARLNGAPYSLRHVAGVSA